MGTARVDVLGVRVSAIDLAAAVDTIDGWIRQGHRDYVCVTGVHGVMESQRDPKLKEIHNNAGLTTPDGMPLVWAGRRAGAASMSRVYGPDLMLSVLERGVTRGWSSFFYGGAVDTPDLLVDRLRLRFPALQVAGTMSPPFRPLTEQEDAEAIARINAASPDIVWVGLSTPKQERWMASHRATLEATVLVGVGAAFDFHAGLVRQAPPWMQQRGLEWLYRLRREPRRLWRRYLRNNPEFLARIVRSRPFLVAD